MPATPIFPLGAVLFPAMPLQLQIFEPRYRQMLSDLLASIRPAAEGQLGIEAEFGVTLIERGREVGGGDQRFDIGTLCRITELEAQGGLVRLGGRGTRRFVVREWLPDEPYPRAEIEELPELAWEARLEPLRQETESLVRRTLARGSEFREGLWSADLPLSPDPMASIWQLAGIAPVGELDQVSLLRARSAEELLHAIAEATEDAAISFQTD